MGLLESLRNRGGLLGTVGQTLTDYQQLANAYPNASKFAEGLIKNLSAVAPPDPRNQQQSMQYAINRAFDVPGGFGGAIDVWHGSPHKFDAFDMSKIGTGEGAQAYGHGLYFAENPEVAKAYTKTAFKAEGVPDDNYGLNEKDITGLLKRWFDYQQINPDEMGYFRVNNPTSPQDKIVNDIIDGKIKQSSNLYKTSLQWPDAAKETSDPLGPQHFLDWEKPYSDQSEKIKEALQSIGFGRSDQTTGRNVYDYLQDVSREKTPVMVSKQFDDREAALNFYNEKKAAYSGKDQFKPLAQMSDGKFTVKYPEESQFNKSGYGPVEDASEYLRSIGIPGIRYLDGGSRGAGDGSYNYVVFDDQIPRILERNGIGLLNSLKR